MRIILNLCGEIWWNWSLLKQNHSKVFYTSKKGFQCLSLLIDATMCLFYQGSYFFDTSEETRLITWHRFATISTSTTTLWSLYYLLSSKHNSIYFLANVKNTYFCLSKSECLVCKWWVSSEGFILLLDSTSLQTTFRSWDILSNYKGKPTGQFSY